MKDCLKAVIALVFAFVFITGAVIIFNQLLKSSYDMGKEHGKTEGGLYIYICEEALEKLNEKYEDGFYFIIRPEELKGVSENDR